MLYSVEFWAILRNVFSLLKGMKQMEMNSFFLKHLSLISSTLQAEDAEFISSKIHPSPVSNVYKQLPYSRSHSH